MDQIVSKYNSFEAASADCVVVTLFRCDRDVVRGWYIGPPSFHPDIPMGWHTGPNDALLAPVAIVRAMEIARTLGRVVCIVDPDGLWETLQGAV